MKILTVSGSSRAESSNSKLLDVLSNLFPEKEFEQCSFVNDLPLFKPENDSHPWDGNVLNWRKSIKAADGVIFCIPEYIHNMPALIKNALEWVVSSGELVGKPVLAMTFTPNEPRGEKAMQSLIWSLQALDARVVGQLALYQNEVKIKAGEIVANVDNLEMLKEAIDLL
ncbi:MAG: chromate reductase [Paraglaciecola sp.]|jgi:chromate reductase